MTYMAILLSFILFYIIQMKLYEHRLSDRMTYAMRCASDEVFEDEDVFLYEELVNDKLLPVPFVKVNADLPDGLYFHFADRIRDEKTGKTSLEESYEKSVQSVYVLQSFRKISRRWRVTCKRRGIYTLGKSQLVTNDLFGLNTSSVSVETMPGFVPARLVVLPKSLDLAAHFTASDGFTGDVITNHSLLTDPLLIAGSRDYRPGDPMRSINWNSTASHGKLMVNVEEHYRRFLFNIVMNMQSRDIENHPDVPSSPMDIERCISVTATLLDRASESDIPVRVFLNTPPDSVENEVLKPLNDDAVGAGIAASHAYSGRQDTFDALRMLAALQMKISVPEEKLLDHILAYPQLYTVSADGLGCANLIFVSAYFSERMLIFHRAMQERGIRVIYYITTANRNAQQLPEDIEIYYSVGSILEPDA